MNQFECHVLHRALLWVVNARARFSRFCYTQFAETFQQTKGLLSADRRPAMALEQIDRATRNVAR